MKHLAISRLTAFAGAACTLALVMSTNSVHVSPTSSHIATDPVGLYLADHPGGKPISDNEVSYGGGAFIVTLTAPAQLMATPDCPLGWFCFYDRTYYGYPRGKLSSCGWQDLARWGWNDLIESVYYNLSSGSVDFINHASGTSSHTNDKTLFTVSASSRAKPDVTPYRNMADHVNRPC